MTMARRPVFHARLARMAAAVCGLFLFAGGAAAHDKAHHTAKPSPSAPRPEAAAVTLHDLPVTDQDRHVRKFKSEVVADRVVVMEFFYSTCGTTCPVTSALLAQVQDSLGDRFGRDVHFVSISVDPVNDTPERLQAYARRYQMRPEWTLLTGSKAAVDKVLEGLGAYTADFRDHPSMVLVGDARRGTWTRLFGLPDTNKILNLVDSLLAHRN